VPIILVPVLVVTLYIIVTLLLWHDLLLRRVLNLNLIIIAISAVNALVCKSTSWLAIKLLLISVFVGQLLYKLCNRGGGGRPSDLGIQFDLQMIVYKGKIVGIEASVPSSPYDLMNVRSWFSTFVDRGNRKMKIIKLT
jgi:hypothetical protein